MNINEYRCKDARQLHRSVTIAYEAKRITAETFSLGVQVAHDIESAYRQDVPEMLRAEAIKRRETFNDLFERDALRGDAGVSP